MLQYGVVLSLLLHLLIIAALLWMPRHHGGTRASAQGQRHAPIVITLARATEQAPASPQVPQPPQPPVPPQTMPTPMPMVQPTPHPLKPKPAPARPSPAVSAGTAQGKQASDAGEHKAAVETDPQAETDAFLQGIRDRWLQPPRSSRDFHCRIKIDYRAGGMISSVKIQDGCGAVTLDDSVERAVWKMQPLPLEAARTQAGSLVVDFSP